MAVDWSTFWSDILSAFIQGLIILILGAVIAWFLTHNYQRRKDRKQVKNQLIDEVQDLILLLEETNISWKIWRENPKDYKNLVKTELCASNAMRKAKIIDTKFDNWIPKFNNKTIIDKAIKEGYLKHEFYDFNETLINYGDSLLDVLDERDTSEENINSIDALYREANRFILMMLHSLIGF